MALLLPVPWRVGDHALDCHFGQDDQLDRRALPGPDHDCRVDEFVDALDVGYAVAGIFHIDGPRRNRYDDKWIDHCFLSFLFFEYLS
ncbi:hypothetical protein D9M69_683640 [compost metagenome]